MILNPESLNLPRSIIHYASALLINPNKYLYASYTFRVSILFLRVSKQMKGTRHAEPRLSMLKDAAFQSSIFKLWALRTHCIRKWDWRLVQSSSVLDLPQLLLGQWSSKDVGGDQHPLWDTPMKSVVGPPEFWAQTGRFNRFLTSLFPSPIPKITESHFLSHWFMPYQVLFF